MPHAGLAHAHALLHVNGASAAGPGMQKLLVLLLRNEDTMKRSSPSTTLQVVFWDHRALFWLPVVQTSKEPNNGTAGVRVLARVARPGWKERPAGATAPRAG